MRMIVLQALAIVVAGLMVGNELCVSAFVHPRLRALDDRAHTAAAQSLARVLGKAMPPWYAATLLLTAAVASSLRHAGQTAFLLAVVSAALWLVSILYSVTALVPLNDQVAKWDLGRLPEDWKQVRLTWDRRHARRVVLLLAALVCLTVACLVQNG